MESTSSSMNSSFESDTKSPDRQERENKHKQDEMFVFMAKIIRIFIKQYFVKCLNTHAIIPDAITAITRCQSQVPNSWTKRFQDLYRALKQHRPLERQYEFETTQLALRRALHVSFLDQTTGSFSLIFPLNFILT